MFKEAKVKELKSFFDHHVRVFETTKEADPARTLTSRILLKRSKNPDGTPRAKARLIVRGFADPDALAGQVETSSPTTTRLSRSMVLSLAATMSWRMWTADVSTAFLQGRSQDRKLWVKLPSEALELLGGDENTRMLLLKPCYGQIDAPRGFQTIMDCNKLLKFAKEHKDVGLCYNHIGTSDQLRMICFFDAGFSARADRSSQGGYILMLINEQLMTSPEEGDYHVIDWRSFKTPRVSRSSLGAEAQAGGQASDAVDFACRYWHHMLQPDLPLKDLLKVTSTLKPVMITDAKALYDSYHRERTSSSVVDKRVSLEIRVMKERLQDLGGVLKHYASSTTS